eukprot:UN13374
MKSALILLFITLVACRPAGEPRDITTVKDIPVFYMLISRKTVKNGLEKPLAFSKIPFSFKPIKNINDEDKTISLQFSRYANVSIIWQDLAHVFEYLQSEENNFARNLVKEFNKEEKRVVLAWTNEVVTDASSLKLKPYEDETFRNMKFTLKNENVSEVLHITFKFSKFNREVGDPKTQDEYDYESFVEWTSKQFNTKQTWMETFLNYFE